MVNVLCPHDIRSVSHNRAINELRNLGLYPVNTQPTSVYPRYNNYPIVLYSYWVYYCEAEGYNKHHAMTRQVLLYLFFGEPEFKSKQFSVLMSSRYLAYVLMFVYACVLMLNC